MAISGCDAVIQTLLVFGRSFALNSCCLYQELLAGAYFSLTFCSWSVAEGALQLSASVALVRPQAILLSPSSLSV
jgi:hypothetical protein